MASIRRTLSPVPRPSTSLNGEACQVPSPLSKSSLCAQNYPASTGLLSSVFGILDPQALVVGVCLPRSSRLVDRSKPKGQTWRRSFLHCLVCFVVGLFAGFTPFFSMSPWTNLTSKQQAFSFEVVSSVGNFQTQEGITNNATLILESRVAHDNASLEPQLREEESTGGIKIDMPTNQSIPKDLELLSRKLVIIVTPTYARPFQAYYLNRLAYTLKLVQPPLLWIVVEMSSQSEEMADILRRSGVMYRHLMCKKNLTDIIDKRVHQRNAALLHIETHHLDGIVHFADDDNVYSADLFEKIRQIRRFGTWTVAKVTENNNNVVLEGPVCNGTQVNGWNVNDLRSRVRRFHADMAGFAFNSTILWDPKRWHRPTLEPIRQLDTVKDGFQASTFIEQVVEDESQMEGLLEDCSRVMVWQLHLESSKLFYPPKWFVGNNLDVIIPLA